MLDKLVPNLLFTFDKQTANRPSSASQPANQPVDFCVVEDRRYNLKEASVAGAVSQLATGAHTETARNCRWLPWIPGKVSYIPLHDDVIVTGETSGCWLVVFAMNGQRYLGHVGTLEDPWSSGTLSATNAWKVAVGRRIVASVRAFNPLS